MDSNRELNDIAAIEARLRDEPSDLRESIVRDAGSFTVALLCVSRSEGRDSLELAGTGTLVSFLNSHYVLTARHVWEEKLQRADRIGITRKEATDDRYLIDPRVVVPFGPDRPQEWNEWGPDLAFLRIPPEVERDLSALGRGVFYNLARPRRAGFSGCCIELRLLMGTPESLGKFTDGQADLEIDGMFSAVDNGPFSSIVTEAPIRSEHDYLDLDVNLAFPGLPENFGGVSGGGLWRVLVYREISTGGIRWVKELEGVAFYQSGLAGGHRILRCHGPQSIGMALSLLV